MSTLERLTLALSLSYEVWLAVSELEPLELLKLLELLKRLRLALSLRYLINVIVKAEDGACQKECLSNVEKKSVCHICYGKHLIGYHHYACANQHHSTCVLYILFPVHSLE